MRKYLVTIAIAALITGCSKSDKVDVSVSEGGVTTDRPAAVSDHNADAGSKIERQYSKSVSYTHLTLPTIYSV